MSLCIKSKCKTPFINNSAPNSSSSFDLSKRLNSYKDCESTFSTLSKIVKLIAERVALMVFYGSSLNASLNSF